MPRAILMAIISSAGLGFLELVSLLFSIQVWVQAFETRYQPVHGAFTSRARSKGPSCINLAHSPSARHSNIPSIDHTATKD